MVHESTRLTVVGIGADGWAGLAEGAREEIAAAEIVLGGARQLAMLPPDSRQQRRMWPSPLRPALERLGTDCAGLRTVVLASGDPMISGIGTSLVDTYGAENVSIIPAVSSVALARARLGWSAESTMVVSVVGRDVNAVARELAPGRRVLVLSSDESTPAAIAQLLVDNGYGSSRMAVLGDLGGRSETVSITTASEAHERAVGAPRLNIVGLELNGPHIAGWTAGLADMLFDNDGQLTKRDLRASALSRLMPAPGHLLWDVGAGAGSVGIEWMRAHPTCRTFSIEVDRTRAERIARNARKLGVPALQIIEGSAPEALTGLPAPDAIFIGGGATRPGVMSTCLSALRAGGRLVVHCVTVETESLLAKAYREHGGELTRIHTETAAPVGSFTGWTPSRAVTQWAFTKH
ncbi:precorrin-6y C5,15-methyltransferase (decarboxylating) subunit CbiE [Mycolicibacterium goodii]|uniref:Tetrapyrrole methylase domain-containing protein n=1 Tax=Mycolicibacterium goodii TaxID=134601 RepID=A0A0K0X8T4_MYCGD|nr:hypothetical protein AFA91_20105 [Mycolicibacterium goodii]